MIYLRIAQPEDASMVATMLAALFEEVEHAPDWEDIVSVFEEINSDDNHETILAFEEDADEPVGVITLSETLSLYAGGTIGVINELFVMPDYRSEGVGKMLLDAVKELGNDRGWKRLEVTTPGDDYEKTLRFYEREGFFRIGPRYKYEI